MAGIKWFEVAIMSRKDWIELPYPLELGSQGRLTVPFEVRKSMGLKHQSKVYIALKKANDVESE